MRDCPWVLPTLTDRPISMGFKQGPPFCPNLLKGRSKPPSEMRSHKKRVHIYLLFFPLLNRNYLSQLKVNKLNFVDHNIWNKNPFLIHVSTVPFLPMYRPSFFIFFTIQIFEVSPLGGTMDEWNGTQKKKRWVMSELKCHTLWLCWCLLCAGSRRLRLASHSGLGLDALPWLRVVLLLLVEGLPCCLVRLALVLALLLREVNIQYKSKQFSWWMKKFVKRQDLKYSVALSCI